MRPLLVVFPLAVLALVVWLAQSPRTAARSAPDARTPGAHEVGNTDLVDDEEDPEVAAQDASSRAEASTTADAERESDSSTFDPGAHTVLTCKLELPDGTPFHRPATGVLLDADGEGRLIAHPLAGQPDVVVFVAAPRGRCTLTFEAEGFAHRPQVLDLTEVSHEERVTLWPTGWISVVLRTPDGRPFVELAEDLGWEPKRLFVHAFDVRASHGAPTATTPHDDALARWRPVPGYQSYALPGGVAGSLELGATPPFWVGLWIHGALHDAQVLQAGATEVVFEVDAAAMLAGTSTVTARVVDRDSDAPAVDAVATLKADVSAHRRKAFADVAPDADGGLVFAGAVPGVYDLTVTRGANLVQREVTVVSGEDLDLGTLAIGDGPGIPLRIVDAAGEPVPAWVEIAPYQAGADVEELYPPNLHRYSRDGTWTLPAPERPSIVRVRVEEEMSGLSHSYAHIRSANHLLDPAALPAELVIEVLDRVVFRVELGTPWEEGDRLTIEDAHGLVVEDLEDAPSGLRLLVGEYTARRWRGDVLLGTLAFDVTAETVRVTLP